MQLLLEDRGENAMLAWRAFRILGLSGAFLLLLLGGSLVSAQQSLVTVCATGCDYTSIQTALSAAPSASSIQVKAGTYQENVTIAGPASGTTLSIAGAGPRQTILQGSIHILDTQGISVMGFTVQSQGVQIQDSGTVTLFNDEITLGNGLSITNSGTVTVQSSAITANHGTAVIIVQGSKAAFSADSIGGNSGDGLNLEGSWALATNNVIANNSACGIRLDAASQIAGSGNIGGGNGGGDACGNAPTGLFNSTPVTPAPVTPTPASCTVTLSPKDSIQQAINDADSGAVICLSAGTFEQNISFSNKSQLSLRGAGQAQTLLTGSSDTGITIDGEAQVTIQGMTVSGFVCAMISARGSTQVNIQDSRLANNGQACPLLEVADSTQVTVQNSQLSGSLEDAIDINSSLVRVSLLNNTISDNRDDAIYLTMLERYQDPATIAQCQGNTFTNNGGGISNNDQIVKKCTGG